MKNIRQVAVTLPVNKMTGEEITIKKEQTRKLLREIWSADIKVKLHFEELE